MNKKLKKLRVDKVPIKPLTNEFLERAAGEELPCSYTLIWNDTCLVTCTEYNCDYSYRNCPSSPQYAC
ncbi:MAG TPA: hypothetical protein VF173_32690 [Thermoanaerobaculia bacterium]|nr:hypothetical protein [Thermoanaerobaculia bacterium]